MMEDIFIIKLILAFIVGSVWITLATVIAEKYGTKVGGVIAGIPSNIVISLFFIGLTQTPVIASQSTSIIPIILGIDALFIVIYVLLSRFNFYFSIITSIIFWFVSTLGLVFLKFDSFMYSLFGFILLLIFSYYILEKKANIKSKSKRTIRHTSLQLLFRGILSGSIITSAVILAKIGGPLLGGAFTSFPAAFLSLIFITHFAHGRVFSSAFMKVVMVINLINCLIYSIAVRYSYLYFGLLYGTLISFIISLISGYLVYLFVIKKMT